MSNEWMWMKILEEEMGRLCFNKDEKERIRALIKEVWTRYGAWEMLTLEKFAEEEKKRGEGWERK